MNPLCQCDEPGWCHRHQMEKNDTYFSLCKGIAASPDCGHKYWMAWERGRAGATAPPNPVVNPPPFCDPNNVAVRGSVPCGGCGRPAVTRPPMMKFVRNAAQALWRFIGDGAKTASESEQAHRTRICEACPLNEMGQCKGCGCILSLKTQARLEQCPASKWFPDLRPPRLLTNPVRNLLMHLLPVERNTNWRWNLQEVAKRQHLFNGKKVLAIAIDDRDAVAGRSLQTVCADEVISYSHCIGLNWDQVDAFPNDNRLREVATFPWLMKQVVSTDPNEVTFYCHGKGVTHSEDSITLRWAGQQFHACLDDWVSVQNALERFSIAGSFRSFGEFKTQGNNRWHFSGTFYWFRHDDVFESDRWRSIDQEFFGVESWPGLMFKPEESACLFGDNVNNPYEQKTWDRLQPEIQMWDGARL